MREHDFIQKQNFGGNSYQNLLDKCPTKVFMVLNVLYDSNDTFVNYISLSELLLPWQTKGLKIQFFPK